MRAPDLEPEKTGSLEPFQFEWNAAIDQRQYLSDSNDQQAGSLLEHSSGFPAEHFPPAQGFGGIYQNFDIDLFHESYSVLYNFETLQDADAPPLFGRKNISEASTSNSARRATLDQATSAIPAKLANEPSGEAAHGSARAPKKTKAKKGQAKNPFKAKWYQVQRVYSDSTLYHKIGITQMEEFLVGEGINLADRLPKRGTPVYRQEGNELVKLTWGQSLMELVKEVHQQVIERQIARLSPIEDHEDLSDSSGSNPLDEQ